MTRFYFFMFFLLITAAAVSVWGATVHNSEKKVVGGVVMSHEQTSVEQYAYIVFTNTNSYDVAITYKIERGPEVSFTLGAKQRQRTLSAYRVDREVDLIVQRAAGSPSSAASNDSSARNVRAPQR